MTIDRTRARAANQNELVERIRDTIIMEHKDLLILVINLENPPGMKEKCLRCGKPDHQPGQKCPAKNAKCKDCHKIGHFHKVCQTKKRAREPIFFKHHPRMMMTPTLMKMELAKSTKGKYV